MKLFLRILFLYMNKYILFLNNLNFGGVQLEALSLAKELKKISKINVFSGTSGKLSHKFNFENIDTHCFNSESSKLNVKEIYNIYYALRNYSFKETPTIISFSVKHTFILSLFNLFRFFKINLIYRHSGLIVNSQQTFFNILINYIVEFINILGSKKVICVSEQNAQFLERIYPFTNKFFFNPTYYETNKFKNRDKHKDKRNLRNRLNLNSDAFIAVCPLSFVPMKNQHLILKIAEQIFVTHNISIKWIFCGDGIEIKKFKNLYEESIIKSDVYITGSVDDIELYISGANLIVSASTYMEGLPQVYSQANYTNTPTVAFDWAGAQDEIKDSLNGFLIQDFNLEQFKERIIDIYFGRTSFKDNFTIYNYDHGNNALQNFCDLISN